jgi:riboflavin synthase
MFTGIIEAKGEITSLERSDASCQLAVRSDSLELGDVSIGDSIAVNGVCLTVTDFGESSFKADVSNETLACTTLGTLVVGAQVNLEKALRADSRLGGHIVSGHVDGFACLLSKETDGDSQVLWFSSPVDLSIYIARKGSVCLDGVSLTVNAVRGDDFSVNIIPHTASATNIGLLETGDRVNLEVDLVSRYLERIYNKAGDDGDHDGLSLAKLKASGFIK